MYLRYVEKSDNTIMIYQNSHYEVYNLANKRRNMLVVAKITMIEKNIIREKA